MVKMLLGMCTSHITVPLLNSRLYSQFQLPANACPGRQQTTAQVLGFLPPTWET